ncbi:MAG: DUF6785 family protein [Candidatus Poribacteria bacterium]|nr:DUF6785 family protein [Candidatus Poribacteria bacterium]
MNEKSTVLTNQQLESGSTTRFIARVLIFGSLLITLNCYWIISAENRVIWELTDFSVFPTVLFTLFALAGVNLLLKRNFSNLALKNSEIAIIYVMVSVSTALAGHDIIRQLVPLMANPFWFATPENEWEELFFRHLPDWLTVPNRHLLRGYFESDENFWQPQYINAWIIPILAWTGFVVLLLFVTLCINIVIRQQWIEHEKLSYPLTVMPVEVIADKSKLFSNKLVWIGFLIAFGLEMVAGLNYLYPSIPPLKIKYVLPTSIRPWNAMSWGFAIYVYPFAIGLTYLMPLDLSLSLWFFLLTWKLQPVILTMLGFNTAVGLMNEQRSGAWIGIGVIALLTSRNHIVSVVKQVLVRKIDDGLYYLAVFGLIFGTALMVLFWYHAGLSPWVAIIYFVIYFVICVGMTRMRAELGPPTHELHGAHPDRLMVGFLGTRAIGAANLTNTTLLSWLAYGYRCHPMPHQLEGFKIGSYFDVRYRRLITAMILASIVGAFLSILLHVSLYHRFQFARWGVGEFNYLRSRILFPKEPNIEVMQHVGIGVAVTAILTVLKRRFIWWPFYPAGYAVSKGWAMTWMWFSIFLGWLAKRLLFSTGGVKYYRIMLPLFLGFIFGQFSAGSLWSLIGIITGKNMYTMFP